MAERFQWVLGIESSCDETAAAVLRDGKDLASNLVASQTDLHQAYGGVVPELASRRHMETVNSLIDRAAEAAGISLADLDGIAVSKGPGLVGALLVGVSTAKALAYSLDVPYVGVNHMEGHIYANWLHGQDIRFPLLGLIVSGGHTALMILEGHGRYRLLGQTRDDAAGEAYDKVARAMGLGYPGGPVLDRLAPQGDPAAFTLPTARLKDDPWGFSFSGLKTAVLNVLNQWEMSHKQINKADLAASFQENVTALLTEKAVAAAKAHGVGSVLLAGGVAANSGLRRKMASACAREGLRLYLPEAEFCTDNAAMIACAGYHRLRAGYRDDWSMNAEPSLGFDTPAFREV
ncbi:MAG: tRNA (adenosine(37)-N6)-threonylcarbamoyltransferase complex transferase subunit TsaD [Clostridiales bacterium]|nr:tRNA (adenosine(37)-N6)-threonylcarbamoyltransferase complex transferase subunit TsaD [Clostridiales bacterium]